MKTLWVNSNTFLVFNGPVSDVGWSGHLLFFGCVCWLLVNFQLISIYSLFKGARVEESTLNDFSSCARPKALELAPSENFPFSLLLFVWGGPPTKRNVVFFWRSLPNLFTHPRVFVRFGRTKGEIWVEKGDFRGDLGGFGGVWTLFGNKPPHPPTFGRDLPKKNGFFFGSPP